MHCHPHCDPHWDPDVIRCPPWRPIDIPTGPTGLMQVLLCLINGCMESATFIFVFFWTPALTYYTESTLFLSEGRVPPGLQLGVVFTAFMACLSLGSAIYGAIVYAYGPSASTFLLLAAAVSGCISALTAAIYPSFYVFLIAFFVMEISIGMYVLYTTSGVVLMAGLKSRSFSVATW